MGQISVATSPQTGSVLSGNQQRVTAGEVHLSGIQSRPERRAEPGPIQGSWAADFRFDVLANTIEFDDFRDIEVKASDQALSEEVPSRIGSGQTNGEIPPITEANVRRLTDDEVLLLLEDHGRRVVGTSDAKLIAPGKVSLIPIIRRKLLVRGEAGQLEATLTTEATYLERWIKSKIDHMQTPTASTIAKVLGSEYALQKQRSTAAIQ